MSSSLTRSTNSTQQQQQQLVPPQGNAAAAAHNKQSLVSLAAPWAAIVLTSLAYAALLKYNNSDNEDDDEIMSSRHWSRWLQEDEHHVVVHHHKQVFNEEHKPLFPLGPLDYYGFAFAVGGLMIAAGGGVGGGGLLVPIYILVMGFSPKHAIPLSNVTVFGGACANTLLNTRKRHPMADRPLVDWDLILVMEPLTIAGALIGAFLNKILPEELLTFLLVVLLSFTANNTLKKATKMYQKETAAFRAAAESELTKAAMAQQQQDDDDDDDNDATDELLKNVEEESADAAAAIKADVVDDIEDFKEVDFRRKELDAILEEERVTPRKNIEILVALFVVVLAINLLKGGGAFQSPLGIRCGSQSFWMANFIMLAWIFGISVYVRNHLIQKHERKLACGYEFLEGDIQWDARATLIYPIICTAAGFFAGMFGIGGGIVKGPLMLAMGVHPAVSSGSSACMILFTSFTATTSFFVFGLLIPDYSLVCLCVGFIATLVGQVGLNYIMKKSKAQRNSYIAFSIGVVVLLSAILMTFQSLMSMASGEKHHSGGICGKAD